jgi:hypothetical protein
MAFFAEETRVRRTLETLLPKEAQVRSNSDSALHEAYQALLHGGSRHRGIVVTSPDGSVSSRQRFDWRREGQKVAFNGIGDGTGQNASSDPWIRRPPR